MLVSVLGDSISTWEGFNPPEYPVFYQKEKLAELGMKSVRQTWWAEVIRVLGAELCANSSWSGSRVCADGPAGAGHWQRIENLSRGSCQPDLVLVYIGTNDYGFGIPVEEREGSVCQSGFGAAYEEMLCSIKRRYPDAQICAATLVKSWIPGKPQWKFPDCYYGIPLEAYNQAIRAAAEHTGSTLIDLAVLKTPYETRDGAHPTREGHRTLSALWLKLLDR